jgi:hypothetical protein
VSQIIAETLVSLKMEFPKPTVDIKEIKERYHKAEEEAASKGLGNYKITVYDS